MKIYSKVSSSLFLKLLFFCLLHVLNTNAFAQSLDSVTISGVVKSLNFNGPVRNHSVYLLPDTGFANYFPSLATLTDSNGIYSFRAPNPQRNPSPMYRVVVPDCRLNQTIILVNASLGYGYGIVGICTSAQRRNLITISGTVVPVDSNTNVGNLPIAINPDSVSIATGNLFPTVIGGTDANGNFSLQVPYDSGQASQDYMVITTCTGLPIVTRATSFANADISVNISFACQNPTVSPVANVRGSVAYASGRPVASYTVTAWQAGGSGSYFTSDIHGRYYFPALPPGSYIFQATPTDSTGLVGISAYAPDVTDWQSATIYRLDSGSVQTINIVVPDLPLLSGTDTLGGVLLFDSTIISNLRSPYIMPFHHQSARIIVRDVATGKDIAISKVDPNGKWKISGLHNGNYMVRVEYPKVSTPLVSATVPGASRVNFSVQGGNVVTLLETSTAKKLLVYPNPSRGIIHVKSATAAQSVVVQNPLGQVVFQKSVADDNLTLDLSSLPGGIYTVVVKTATAVEQTKVVLQ